MARITVEDCLDNVANRFELVLVAAKRARQLANGSPTTLEWENDKPTVVALREIADGLIGPAILDAVEEPADEAPDAVARAAALFADAADADMIVPESEAGTPPPAAGADEED